MSGSAPSTKSIAHIMPKFVTTSQTLQERLSAVETALTGKHLTSLNNEEDAKITTWKTQLLAEGGYNYVWLVSYTPIAKHNEEASFRKIVIREPKEGASIYQLENEIAFLTYLTKHHPSIPVPKLYTYNLNHSELGSPFIAMEYIEGQALDTLWCTLSETSKDTIASEIAQVIVDLGEINLGGIGSLIQDDKLGPTVEGVKFFKGREKLHSRAYYDIGPYTSTQSYAVACYDKEICYYTHASDEDLEDDLFDEKPRAKFIAELQSTRDSLASDATPFSPQEPFALVHGDFCGRNIMVHDGHIKAILDWEFAGSYPLSELLGGMGIELFELEDENLAEYGHWSDMIRDKIVEEARERNWDEGKIELMVGEGNRELQLARREMIPMSDDGDDNTESIEVDGDDGQTVEEISVDTLTVAEADVDK